MMWAHAIKHESNHSFIKRNSQDKTCCSRGRELLDLCTSCNIHILNGRTIGDLSGNLTSFQFDGNSVVDYCLVSDQFLHSVN